MSPFVLSIFIVRRSDGISNNPTKSSNAEAHSIHTATMTESVPSEAVCSPVSHCLFLSLSFTTRERVYHNIMRWLASLELNSSLTIRWILHRSRRASEAQKTNSWSTFECKAVVISEHLITTIFLWFTGHLPNCFQNGTKDSLDPMWEYHMHTDGDWVNTMNINHRWLEGVKFKSVSIVLVWWRLWNGLSILHPSLWSSWALWHPWCSRCSYTRTFIWLPNTRPEWSIPNFQQMNRLKTRVDRIASTL